MRLDHLPDFMTSLAVTDDGVMGTIETGAEGDAWICYTPGAAEIHIDGNISLDGLRALVQFIEANQPIPA